jgi:hypothetical protein
MIITKSQINRVIEGVLNGHRSAVSFTPDLKDRVKATEVKAKHRTRSIDIRLTLGPPNYKERQFLKLCKKAKTKPKPVWYP